MYKRTLDAVERASHNGRKQARNFSSTASIEKKVAALAKSCMELSENSLLDIEEVYNRTPSAMARKIPPGTHWRFFSTSLETGTFTCGSKSTSDCLRFAWKALSWC
ncbi:hypothetical protein MRX96_048841 [Rhipicephalus microplus]